MDTGPFDAKIMLIGEAPGAQEERIGLPFVGPAGNLLKQLLSHSGIDYSQCYATNVMNVRPPNNDFAHFYQERNRKTPTPQLADGWEKLRQKIETIKPNIVILLGAEPLRAVTGKMGIMTWRGSVLSFRGIKVISTYHPSNVLRVYENHVICEHDFTRALEESLSSELNVPTLNLRLLPSFEETTRYLSDARKSRRISFDLETTGDLIRQIGFAFRNHDGIIHAISIPFMKSGLTSSHVSKTVIKIAASESGVTSYWTPEQEVSILTLIAEILEDEKIQKVGQNSISFDQNFLEKQFGISVQNHYMDTMHAHHLCYAEFLKSLDFMCTLYTKHSNYWTEKVTADDLSQSRYNAMDCVVTLECSERLDHELKSLEMEDLYFNHVHRLSFALTRAQNHGILIDIEKRKDLLNEYEGELEVLQKEINDLAGQEVNINSPKQMKQLLYEKLKFPVQLSKTRKETTDANALKVLLKKYPREEILQKILAFREKSKLISTYLKAKLDADGVFRTSYNPSGTVTGRISSSQTLEKRGGNLQNIPKRLRQLFIARPGCSFVKGDLSQAETRVVSEILKKLGDRTLSDKYASKGFDIHKWTASPIYHKPENEITSTERSVGKVSNHSGNYGAGPNVLVKEARKRGIETIDVKFARRMLEERHRQIPGLKKWWRQCEQRVKRTRCITTCLGRKRFFFGRFDNQTYRAAYAQEPQSTIGDVNNKIFYLCDELMDSDCHPVLQVHDETVVECPDEKVDLVIEQMKKIAQIPLFINESPLFVPIDISVGKNWRETKPIDE